MSKITSIQPNYQPVAPEKGKTNYKNNPSFGLFKPVAKGKYADLGKADDELVKLAKECELAIMTPVSRFGAFLSKHDSEVEKQLINAVFTCSLAPTMIAFNPLSKDDSKRKKYMALRQPISALVAIGGSAPLTMLMDRGLANIFSNGLVKSLDMRMSPDKQCIRREVLKAHPEYKFFNRRFSKEKNMKLDNLLEIETSKYSEFFSTLLSSGSDKIRFENGEVKILGKELKEDEKTCKCKVEDNPEKVMSRKVPNINSQEDLDKFLDLNAMRSRKLKEIMKNDLGFEFFENGQIKEKLAMSRLENTSAVDFLKKIGMKNVTEADLVKSLNKIYQDNIVNLVNENSGNSGEKSKLIDNINEILKSASKVEDKTSKIVTLLQDNLGSRLSKEAMDKLNKGVTRNIEYHLGGINDGNLKMSQLFHRLNYVDSKGNLDLTKIEALMDENLPEVLNKLVNGDKNQKYEGLKVLFEDGKEKGIPKVEEFLRNFAKNDIKNLSEKLKTYKGYVGIVSNLFIVAVTCTILNIVYPRIVRNLFPKLVQDDKTSGSKEGGNK